MMPHLKCCSMKITDIHRHAPSRKGLFVWSVQIDSFVSCLEKLKFDFASILKPAAVRDFPAMPPRKYQEDN